MGASRECEFTEVQPGEWFYVLEDYDAPKNAWDWREYATAYGPFATQEKAESHLQSHARTSGCTINEYDIGFKADDVMQNLVAKARLCV